MWTMKLKMCQINEARFFFLISRGARTPTNLIHSTVRIRLDICTLLSWPYYQSLSGWFEGGRWSEYGERSLTSIPRTFP